MRLGIRITSVYGAPVYVHLSFALVLLFYIEEANFLSLSPVILLAYLVLILTHELGHAFFANRAGFEVDQITLYVIHGICSYYHDDEEAERLSIAIGGVLFQAILLVAWLLVSLLAGEIETPYLQQAFNVMSFVFIPLNILTIIFNLLPIPGLDGYTVFSILYRRLSASFSSLIKNRRPPARARNRGEIEHIVSQAIQKAQKSATKK